MSILLVLFPTLLKEEDSLYLSKPKKIKEHRTQRGHFQIISELSPMHQAADLFSL